MYLQKEEGKFHLWSGKLSGGRNHLKTCQVLIYTAVKTALYHFQYGNKTIGNQGLLFMQIPCMEELSQGFLLL